MVADRSYPVGIIWPVHLVKPCSLLISSMGREICFININLIIDDRLPEFSHTCPLPTGWDRLMIR